MIRLECRAVLFDLDGVLVNSSRYIEELWRKWAEAKGLSAEPFLRVCHGRRAVETITLAAPHLDAEAEIAAFVPENPDPGVLEPIDGAARLLRHLPGDSWAVATSGSRATATARLGAAGLPLPDVLVCAEDVVRGKPFPDVYLMAAAKLGVPPRECLVVEDAPPGVQAGRSAGMRVLALTTTHRLQELDGDVYAATLAAVHLGRIDRSPQGQRLLELLVVDS